MNRQSSKRFKVAIDLTPMRPGGENGGSKRLVLTLLSEFSQRRSDQFEYLIITDEWNYDELLEFCSENVTCISKTEIFFGKNKKTEYNLNAGLTKLYLVDILTKLQYFIKIFLQKMELKLIMLRFVLGSSENYFLRFLSGLFESTSSSLNFVSRFLNNSKTLQIEQGVDLLFCPFTSPTFAEKGLPLVAIVYDLQHLDMPHFFSSGEWANRTKFLTDLLRQSNQIISISDFTKQSYINYFKASSQQVLTVPVCIHENLEPQSQAQVTSTLDALGLEGKRYLFFPANFWPHKNHHMLLEAYKIYRNNHLNDAVDLVFTGALESGQKKIENLTNQIGLSNSIYFMGFLDESELISIWQGCQGLIFPSLYEGFGIPLLEAMWFKKPIACSRVGSLPEVGGSAAVYFDPSKPTEISWAIHAIAHDQALVADLVDRGQSQLQNFSQSAMADQYMDIFKTVLSNR